MRRFDIAATPKAQSDVDKLRFAIAFKFRAPLTAKRYVEGLNKKVQSLKVGADAIQIDKAFSAQYGYDVRRINYKEMAILYSIEGNVVIIQRIIPQNMVIY